MYSKGIAPFYDFFEPSSGKTDPAAAFINAHLQEPASVLEIGAGLGTTAFALGINGIPVTALEPDPEMYAIALSRLGQDHRLANTVTLLPRLATPPYLNQSFDVCACFAVLHLLSDEPRSDILNFAHHHLREKGLLLVDVRTPSPQRLAHPLRLVGTRRLGDITYTHYAALEQQEPVTWKTTWLLRTEYAEQTVHEVEQSFIYRLDTLSKTEDLLARHGFHIQAIYADYNMTPFIDQDSNRLLVVAQRSG